MLAANNAFSQVEIICVSQRYVPVVCQELQVITVVLKTDEKTDIQT